MNIRSRNLKLHASVIALFAAASFAGSAAMAQTAGAPAGPGVETVTVTGTAIRGVETIGSNVLSVDQTSIQATAPQSTQDLLNKIPAISDSGAAPQGALGNTGFAPNIHQLGGSSSNATLVLLDGNRFIGGSNQHSMVDPGIVPSIAMGRVEVLTDGASSIYGSDAVAGVVNFITRGRFDGFEATGQAGEAADYDNYSASAIAGKDWGSGGAYVAALHSYASSLSNNSRLDTRYTNLSNIGGKNNASYDCSPAAINPTGTTNVYLSATATTPFSNSSGNTALSPCDYHNQGDNLPKETRDAVFVKGEQQFGRVTFNGFVDVSMRSDISTQTPQGSTNGLSATAFGSGPQANPFYQNVPGSTASSEKVFFDTAGLVPNQVTHEGSETIYGNFGVDWNIDDNWHLTASNTAGYDVNHNNLLNKFCASCVDLAINGTTNSAGSLTTPSIPKTNIVYTQGLSALTALDVWNPPATNHTSAATLGSLTTGGKYTYNYNNMDQIKAGIGGALFDLPAGALKVAFGVENYNQGLIQDIAGNGGLGPDSQASTFQELRFGRNVQSAYLELDIPVISPAMGIPFAQKVDIDLSGRTDRIDYIHAKVANPKYSISWQVNDSLKVVSSYSTSFVAPQVDEIGDPKNSNDYAVTTVGGYGSTGAFTINPANYPGAGNIPGCNPGAATCTLGNGSTVDGTFIANGGGGTNLKPETGNSWSIGLNLTPTFLKGFLAQLTFFNNALKGAIASTNAQVYANNPVLAANHLTVCPTGCTAAQINAQTGAAPFSGIAYPTTSYFIFNTYQDNIEYINVAGFDLSAQYSFDTDNYGTFIVSDNATQFVRFHLQTSPGGPIQNILNTSGIVTQFPSVATRHRFDFGWIKDEIQADIFVNYVGNYRNVAGGTNNPLTACGVPPAGTAAGTICGDSVGALATVDLHVSYNFDSGWLSGQQIYFDAKNLLNTPAPFLQSTVAASQGYDHIVANPIGQLLSIGFRAKL